MKMYSYEDIFKNKKKILFVTAHPDDVEVFFGGTLSRLNSDKKEVFVLVATTGGRGGNDKTISEEEMGKIRREEELSALKILGVSAQNFSCLGYLDGEVENNLELIGGISAVIKKFQPEIVCTHEPHGFYYPFVRPGLSYINHRDHRNVGMSVMDAVSPFARGWAFFKEQSGFQPFNVYEILFTGDFETNTKIDITGVFDEKRRALLSHKSQFDEDLVREIMGDYAAGGKYFEAGNYIKLAW